MEEIVIYEKPTCSKCRLAASMLEAAGTTFRRVRYYDEPLTESKLKELLRKINVPARDLLRANEPLYRELGLAKRELSDDELVSFMARYPDLMQRPILERGDAAIIGRPAKRITEFLKA